MFHPFNRAEILKQVQNDICKKDVLTMLGMTIFWASGTSAN